MHIWLAGLAMLAMALVPTGFMPAHGATGLALVPCPSAGPAPEVDHAAMGHHDMADAQDGAPSGAEQFSKSKNCSLGSVAPVAMLPPAAVRMAEVARREAALAPRYGAVRVAPIRLRPPSRAPPSA